MALRPCSITASAPWPDGGSQQGPTILAAPGLRVASVRHTHPQAAGSFRWRLRGGTYATSATLRPLVGGVVLWRPVFLVRVRTEDLEAGCC